MRSPTEIVSRALLCMCALVLCGGAVLHTAAFKKAAHIASESNLPPLFIAAFKGLWLIDSVSSLTLGAIFAGLAVNPRWAALPIRCLLALAPLAIAAVLFATMGSFFGGYLMFVAGALGLLGTLLSRPTRELVHAG